MGLEEVQQFEKETNAAFETINNIVVDLKLDSAVVAVASLRVYVSACLQRGIDPKEFETRTTFLVRDYKNVWEKKKNGVDKS